VYLCQNGKVEFVATDHKLNRKEIFHYVKKIKSKLKAKDLVGNKDQRAYPLLKFLENIFSLEYD
jgi:hypothetical protein